MGSKGIHLSTTAVVISVVVVIALLVTEGLLIGLLGQPTCDNIEVDSSTTTIPVKPTTEATTTPGPGEIWDNPRLPLNLMPIDYTLSLRPVLEINADGLYVFYGSSSTRYTCVTSTEYVIMHAIDLEFSDQWSNYLKIVDKADNSNQAIADVMFYLKTAYIVVTLESPCEEGHIYEISFSDFWGELGDDLDGLYRSEYVNENGDKRVIATTQMQVEGARRTFPCFDEPAFKANFTTTLYYREDLNYHAISNMNPKSNTTETIDGDVWQATTFEVTPTMSTYLLAMVVSDFSYEEAFTVDGIQTRIYARKTPVDNGEVTYAAQVSPEILDVLADHYNVPYPLPKSDQLAAPDFGAGAMENWGLVIYREIYLLYDETVSSVYNKYSVAQVIAHELAHQWFGNLVTAAWWSDTWLNEGFASYVQYIGVDGVHPDWKFDELFIIYDLQGALSADAYSSSHPLHHPQGYFSTITYSKGGSFLRMVQEMLGEDIFTGALTKYLEGQQYDVADYNTLFKYWIDEVANSPLDLPYDLQKILETWVLQMGYPLLTLTRNGDEVTVTQEYFLVDENDSPVSTPGSDIYNYMWYVPFNYRFSSAIGTGGAAPNKTWLSTSDASTTISITDESEYILGNVDAKGYYRVAYDKEMWAAIVEKMNSSTFKDISPQNRAQLIDDVFAVTRSGRVSVESALDLTLYLKQELDYIPWYTFYDVMVPFDRLLAGSTIYGDFSKYVVSLIEPSIYKEYGWNDTNTNDSLQVERMTRGRAIDGACHFGLEDCINEAVQMYREWMADPSNNNISPTYRSYVYCTAIREGDEDEWDFAWEQYLATDSAQEKTALRIAMACSRESWILTRYIEYCLDNTLVRNQDVSATLRYIGDEEDGKYAAWSFAVNHWDVLTSTVGNSPINSMLSAASRRFSTEFDLQLIEILRPIAGDVWTSTLNSYHNTVVDNMEWRAKNEPKIKAWLNNDPPPVVKSKKVYPRFENVDRDVIEEHRGMYKKF